MVPALGGGKRVITLKGGNKKGNKAKHTGVTGSLSWFGLCELTFDDLAPDRPAGKRAGENIDVYRRVRWR